jgi:hypothetical protein
MKPKPVMRWITAATNAAMAARARVTTAAPD